MAILLWEGRGGEGKHSIFLITTKSTVLSRIPGNLGHAVEPDLSELCGTEGSSDKPKFCICEALHFQWRVYKLFKAHRIG